MAERHRWKKRKEMSVKRKRGRILTWLVDRRDAGSLRGYKVRRVRVPLEILHVLHRETVFADERNGGRARGFPRVQ